MKLKRERALKIPEERLAPVDGTRRRILTTRQPNRPRRYVPSGRKGKR